MRHIYLYHRLSLLFKTRNKRMRYLRRLPIEVRYDLAYSIGIYRWSYLPGLPRNIWYTFNRVLDKFSEKRRIKLEWWNLDSEIAKFVLPRLRMLRNHHQGYPARLPNFDRNERKDTRNENWEAILDDMIYAFEYQFLVSIRYNGVGPYTPTNPLYDMEEENKERRDRGFKLFIEYYNSLWD